MIDIKEFLNIIIDIDDNHQDIIEEINETTYLDNDILIIKLKKKMIKIFKII